MYLKSIEMQGFKSFANKIHFDFRQGITAIVGPNGSGKSNVADAVRWVLGEQSAKELRGAKMEDVIFAGTQNRKPLGFASVSITFDNADHVLQIDYDEVTVTRRVYRSGESEYKINGNVCRLKDIQELFYDTGIGQEGYSIIGQGQIEKILSGKPEERRELFDEAAGIVKFKRRKAEAVRKLEKEQDSLTRVDDILAELTKQVGPLEEESKKAKEYLGLRDTLKKYDVNSFLIQNDQLRAGLSENGKLLAAAESQVADAKKELETTRSEYDKAEEEIAALEKSIHEKEEKQNEISVNLERLSGSRNLSNEQLDAAAQDLAAAQSKADAAQEALKKAEEESVQLEEQRTQMSASLSEYRKSQKDLEEKQAAAEQDIRETEAAIERCSAQVIAGLSASSETTAQIREQETLKSQYGIRKATLQNRIVQRKTQEKEQNNVVSSFEKELQELKEESAETEKRIKKHSDDLASLRLEESKAQDSLNRMTSEFHREKSRAEALSAIAERYDGYGNAVRRIMQMKDKKSGIRGVVADLIQVEKRYETAVETALGGAIQNIVTDSEGTAKDLIRFLKETHAGRATFLPLDALTVRGTIEGTPALQETGAIGVASDLVTFAPEYKVLARFLLGRVLIADTIDNALKIARKYRYSLRIVTLEGEQLNPGGSMTGGAFKTAGNLLGRRREIETAEANVKRLTESIQKLRQSSEERRNRQAETRRALEQDQTRLQEIRIAANTAGMNLKQASEKKDEIVTLYSGNGDEVRDLTEKIAAIDRALAGKQQKLQELREEGAARKKEQEELARERSRKEETLNALREAGQKLKLTYASTLQKEEFLGENRKRIQEQKNQLAGEIQEAKKKISEAQEQKETLQEQIRQISLSCAAGEKEQASLAGELDDLRKRRDTAREKNKTFFERREQISSDMNDMEKEVFRLSSRKEKLEETLSQLSDYMWNEYELTYSSASAMRDPELTVLSKLKKDIAQCRQSIKALGSVNVNAIAQYKEVSGRYEFLTAQHDDLVKAAASLQKIIGDLDDGMRRQFREKFRIIQNEFNRVFKELFGGGNGTILLDETEDILEAGITVVSQPPGKKLQNMMQLSGGEKALTAIALLFAIQSLKPSPFCLLDEIEAALDDANVSRFADYLHRLTDHTQFIVITHRRGTMNAADRLYGITMQEKGVSTLVSVDLISNELDEEEQKGA
ncbi:MAG: chromosome segregation protein SMC [Lachnospiraceae bacterium]|jgi:chromosome segregation protein|nr:chromosome segregation protein SMC [Lachnospiraceae bacterium]MCH4030447.1 chromosome segregation protein SMC [Lachnospiraceae bacterium]MCH4069657.1 chromosome segregation protein SMC [Lachnospiraceae bacterium]MCH4107405.1 chromosome segregation protein SMC [Lachnospiraceae bacterium]MCI1301741.1 chromosome segregation protein SMC [Lachnospiraceae bacterium]